MLKLGVEWVYHPLLMDLTLGLVACYFKQDTCIFISGVVPILSILTFACFFGKGGLALPQTEHR